MSQEHVTPERVDPADDELARQLRGVPPGALPAASDAAFREALFRRTAARVRRRPLRRRLAAAAALVLAYGAGIATARLGGSGEELRRPPPQLPAAPVPPAALDIALEPPAAAPDLGDADPRELEERALASPRERRIELLKLAGDRYLDEGQELEAAVRCYRGALSLMRSEERASVSSKETWLLAALKCSRS